MTQQEIQTKNLDEKRKKLLLARRNKMEQLGLLIFNRNKFYASNLRFLSLIWVLLFFTLIFFIAVIYFSSIKEVKSWFIQARLNGKVITVEDIQTNRLDTKEITNQNVVDWVLEIIPSIYNYNFVNDTGNYRDVISYFTPTGFQEYQKAITQSKLLESIKATNMVVLGVGCGNSESYVIEQGVRAIQGYPVYSWTVKVPFVARNISYNKSLVKYGELTLGIQRVPQMFSPNGMAVWQFVFQQQSEESGDAKFDELCYKYFGI